MSFLKKRIKTLNSPNCTMERKTSHHYHIITP